MFKLDQSDIKAHKYLASKLDMEMLEFTSKSINQEYLDLENILTEQEKSNYLKLLDIYTKELVSRKTNKANKINNLVH